MAATDTDQAWRVAAATLSIAAGAIHLVAFGSHHGTLGILIALTGAAQVSGGALLLVVRLRGVLLASAAINAAAVAAWIASRTVGLPLPGSAGEVESVGLQDGICALLGVGAFVAALVACSSWAERLRLNIALVAALSGIIGLVGVFAPSHHTLNDQSVPVLEAGVLSDRLPLPEGIALLGLSARPLLAGAGGPGHSHGVGHGNGFQEPAPPQPLSAEQSVTFEEQWAATVDAAQDLATLDRAEAAGYRQAATQAPGIGAHWVKWSLVDRPFDPARPSMLLFSPRQHGQPPELVGFSYWVASAEEPEGFAGPNDHWHSHQGMCFIDGWLKYERVERRKDCEDTWIEGSDLWMLHAWPVAEVPNRWGQFADMNPALCGNSRQTPDIMRCDPGGL